MKITFSPGVKTSFEMVDRWPADAIILTLSGETIKKRKGGLRQILKEWKDADGNTLWYYKSGTAPKDEVQTVYWVIAGRIRWKSKLAFIERNQAKKFSNHSEPIFGKVWFALFDFEPIPRSQQAECKGFQGFRYFFDNQTKFTTHARLFL